MTHRLTWRRCFFFLSQPSGDNQDTSLFGSCPSVLWWWRMSVQDTMGREQSVTYGGTLQQHTADPSLQRQVERSEFKTIVCRDVGKSPPVDESSYSWHASVCLCGRKDWPPQRGHLVALVLQGTVCWHRLGPRVLSQGGDAEQSIQIILRDHLHPVMTQFCPDGGAVCPEEDAAISWPHGVTGEGKWIFTRFQPNWTDHHQNTTWGDFCW